jgi:2-methylcitrate dehydratase PrpD
LENLREFIMADETRTLAKFVANFKLEDAPVPIRNRMRDLLVDQIGIEIGCSHLPWAQQVRETYRKVGGVPEATVLGYGDKLPLTSVAFINATFGHSFEYDDANPLVHGHPGCELIPSLLAVAEREHCSGREFLTTLTAAYEIRGRIGWAVSPDMLEHGGPQYSTTCGPFGVAAGVARLLSLPAEGIRDAMGIAGTFSGGLMQYDHGGGSAKRIFGAVAAINGMQSALLAQAGITGPEEIIEGKRGLLRIFPKEYRPDRLTVDLGKKWMIDHILFKPYCCCAVIHPAIDACRMIVEQHNLNGDAIDTITVDYPKGSYDHSAITDPQDLLTMQFSTSYSLALTVIKRRNTPREYTMDALRDQKMKELAAKVSLREDAELDRMFKGGHMPARVKIKTKAGDRFEQLVLDAKGSPGVPYSSHDVDEKFRSLTVDALGKDRAEHLLDMLRNVEKLRDMTELTEKLVFRQAEKIAV